MRALVMAGVMRVMTTMVMGMEMLVVVMMRMDVMVIVMSVVVIMVVLKRTDSNHDKDIMSPRSLSFLQPHVTQLLSK